MSSLSIPDEQTIETEPERSNRSALLLAPMISAVVLILFVLSLAAVLLIATLA